MTRCRTALAPSVVAALLAVTGCGGSTDNGSSNASDQQPTASSSPTDPQSTEPNTEASTPATRVATCTLKGRRKADVTLTDTGDALVVTFNGQAVPSNGDSLYSVTAFDKAGENGVQLGISFLDGEQDAYFVFDFGTAQQANLTGDAVEDGKTVSGTFPSDQLGKVYEEGVAFWTAGFNALGDDVGTCPGGIGALPFPG